MRRAILVSAMVSMALVLAGCNKKTDTAAAPGAAPAKVAAAADVSGKTCPVMKGRAVNPDLFVEYQGKKIYVCCRKCLAEVKAHPEKYADGS